MASTRYHTSRRITGEDVTLAVRLRAGDRDAFDELFRRHHRPVTRYVAARMRERDRDAVDDLVQDTFCDALADPTLIGADVLGCLLRLAARACTRHERATRRYTRAAYTVYEDRTSADPGGTGQPAAPSALRRPQVIHALARLSPDQRRAVQLRYLDGHPRQTVAVLMNRSVEAVKGLERRARRHLRQQLATAATEAGSAPAPATCPA